MEMYISARRESHISNRLLGIDALRPPNRTLPTLLDPKGAAPMLAKSIMGIGALLGLLVAVEAIDNAVVDAAIPSGREGIGIT